MPIITTKPGHYKEKFPLEYNAVLDLATKSEIRIGRYSAMAYLKGLGMRVSERTVKGILLDMADELKSKPCSKVKAINNQILGKSITGVQFATKDEQVMEQRAFDFAVRQYIMHSPRQIIDVCDKFNKPPREIFECLDRLKNEGFMVDVDGAGNGNVIIPDRPEAGGLHTVNMERYANKPIKIGAIADTHLCSKYYAPEVAETLYDLFAKEGITDVYHAGNYVDGEAPFNRYDLVCHGLEAQLEFFAKNYPQRDGITTHFIAGDDHEGWWCQREGIDIGRATQAVAERHGRTDLHYLGYMEANVDFKTKDGVAPMKVMHPGGGSSYAFSYKSQKIAESMAGAEKPKIMLLGHYHKMDLCYARGVWCVQLGSTQRQTPFMRKKSLESHLGGAIIEFVLADDGSISRFKCEFIPFYDKKFYENDFKRF